MTENDHTLTPGEEIIAILIQVGVPLECAKKAVDRVLDNVPNNVPNKKLDSGYLPDWMKR